MRGAPGRGKQKRRLIRRRPAPYDVLLGSVGACGGLAGLGNDLSGVRVMDRPGGSVSDPPDGCRRVWSGGGSGSWAAGLWAWYSSRVKQEESDSGG
jgi:hypothetical protein